MKKENNITNIIKRITVILIALLAMFGIISKVNAATDGPYITRVNREKIWGSTVENMPAKDVADKGTPQYTGYFPQRYNADSKRAVYINSDRFNVDSIWWNAAITGKTVFCSKLGGAVKYGTFDPDQHYFYPTSDGTGTYVQIKGSSYSVDGTYTMKSIKAHLAAYKDDDYDDAKTFIKNDEGIKYNGEPEIGHYVSGSLSDDPDIDVPSELDINAMSYLIAHYRADEDHGAEIDGGWTAAGPHIRSQMTDLFLEVFDKMDGSYQAKYVADTDETEGLSYQERIEIENQCGYGPKIKVQDPYEETTSGTFKSGTTETDSKKRKVEIEKAFIFTVIEKAYNNETGKYADKYSLNDIQTAYWWILDEEGGINLKNIRNSNHATTEGLNLYLLSEKYAKFVMNGQNESKNYNASIDKSEAKVIVNKDSGYYYVGPFSVTYPYFEDFSYLKALVIDTVNEAGKTHKLTYGQGQAGFEVILSGGATNQENLRNGLNGTMPANGQKFYIKFSAATTEYPTDINLTARFEYLAIAETNYTYLESGSVKIYQYMGHYTKDGESNAAAVGTVKERFKFKIYDAEIDYTKWDWSFPGGCNSHTHYVGEYGDPDYERRGQTCHHPNHDSGVCSECGAQGTKVYEQKPVEPDDYNAEVVFEYIFTEPYIQMKEDPVGTDTPQKLIIIGDVGQRQYITKDVKVTVSTPPGGNPPGGNPPGGNPPPYVIDLTTELGGYVWVESSGKEDVPDGSYSSGEERVPNILVRLYRTDGQSFVGKDTNGNTLTSTTDENGKHYIETKTDSNGTYKFLRLNSMFKYYVRFYYNGQYYEATTYTSPTNADNGWNKWANERKGNWPNNSNATERIGDRQLLNQRFAEIGSSPNNYDGSKQTYRRDELKNAGIIDAYGNLISSSNSSMATYVSDCLISAYTGDTNTIDQYPIPNLYVIDNKNIGYNSLVAPVLQDIGKNTVNAVYEAAYYINLGLKERQESDIAVKKDVQKVDLEINGQRHTYTYNSLENKIEADESWTIGVNMSDAFKNNYDTSYTRELYKSDYLYKVSAYGTSTNSDEARKEALAKYGKTQSDELNVYVTYKVMVRNQSLSIKTRIDELVDYYDDDYELVPERSYIQIPRGSNSGKYDINLNTDSMYGEATELDLQDYNETYISGLGKNGAGIYLDAGQTAYFYITFKVNKHLENGELWLNLDEDAKTGAAIGNGKENIVELNGYATMYADGTIVPNIGDVSGKPAGIVDRDSNPGNITSNDPTKFEDDTSNAPTIRIILYRNDNANRVIAGSVWEDLREKQDNGTSVGNGLKDGTETTINGVTVQLVELMDNGEEFVWREFGSDITGNGTVGTGTGSGSKKEETPIINEYNLVQNYVFGDDEYQNGAYAFKSFAAGKYVVRFIYGDEKTVITKEIAPLLGKDPTNYNEKSYNGQDYKSTTYQKDILMKLTPYNEGGTIKYREYQPSDGSNYVLGYKVANGLTYNYIPSVFTWEQSPRRLVLNEDGTCRDWKTEDGDNFVYGYKVFNGSSYQYIQTWDKGEAVKAPILTQVSGLNANASNNATVELPSDNQVTLSNYNSGLPGIYLVNQVGYLYDVTASSANDNVSDAKDIKSVREAVNQYSNAYGAGVTNYLAEVLASHKADVDIENESTNDRNTLLQDLINNTKMTAETGVMLVQIEFGKNETDGQVEGNSSTYKINNVNLGLEERPKAQLAIEKEVTRARLTLADSSTLFDAKGPQSNVLWREHTDYKSGYKDNKLDPDLFGNIANIRSKNAAKFGLIQLTMDEELMHGATIKLDYDIKVRNIGELDYNDDLFYYTGVPSATAAVVTTSAEKVLDYVSNNLKFYANDNENWNVIENDEVITNGLVNKKLETNVNKFNTIITTDDLSQDLVPEIYDEINNTNDSVSNSVPLVLTQLITSENNSDDLTYNNLVEIVKTSNTVGRRNEFSIVGNQDPTKAPQELDSDRSETVRILPPFGEITQYIIISAVIIVTVGIVIVGIIFIKKKVLTK